MRYLVIGFTAKGNGREFSSVKGYVVNDDESIPNYSTIRREALDWANRDCRDFEYFQMNFMQYLDEADCRGLFSEEAEQNAR